MNRITSLTSSFADLSENLKKTIKDKEPEKINHPEDIMERHVVEKLNLLPESELIDFSYKYSNKSGIYDINIILNSSKPISDNLKTSLKSVLERDLNRKVILNINLKN